MNFQEVTKYTGIDISGTLLKKTKGILPFVETRKSNVMNLEEYHENTFDYLSVFAGLHHIPDISATINESYRVLKKGGIFVAFEPNLDAFYGWLLLKIGKKLKMYTMDETFLKSSSICKHLEKTGFKNIKVHFITPRYDFKNLRNKKKYRIAYSIMKLFSFFPGKYTNSFFVITTYK
jgi:ubiquinone/menaquinone biosynthesis C-methylase UbiE